MSSSILDRNRNLMKQFEIAINTANLELANQLISDEAKFVTPASPEPLVGGKGYLSNVYFMRKGFSDVQWKLEEMIVEEDKCAVRWTVTGTHDGEFLGVKPTYKKIKSRSLNFYYFNDDGKIINDVAGENFLGVLRGVGLSKY